MPHNTAIRRRGEETTMIAGARIHYWLALAGALFLGLAWLAGAS